MDGSDTNAALAAAAALLASADGADPQGVRTRLRAVNPKAVAAFDGHLEHHREDAGKGETAALQNLHPVKGDARAASAVMEAALRAGGGTDGLAPAQTAVARRICETLNLSPARFGL